MDLSSKGSWRSWKKSLLSAGCAVCALDAGNLESLDSRQSHYDAVVIDGTLPDCIKLVLKLRPLLPQTKMVLASETSSFSAYYEAMQIGAFYLAEPRSPQHVVEKLKNLMSAEPTGSSNVLPHWI